MSTLPETVAILTGDLVKSSRLPAEVLAQFPATMDAVVRRAREVFGEKLVPRPIDVFRGDGWQWLVTDPTRAVRTAIFVRAALRSRFPNEDLDTRIAIGIGPVQTIPEDRVSQGFGAAFEASGRALEDMPRKSRLTLARAGVATPACERLEAAALGLVDLVVTGWTAAQARAVEGALCGLTQEEIAAAWEPAIDRSAVARHLEKAGWETVAVALEALSAVTSGGHNG